MVIPFRRRREPRPRVVSLGWLMTAAGVVAVAAPPATAASPAQPPIERAAALAEEVRARFEVTALSDGVRLFPRSPVDGVGVVELSDGVVAVDGRPVSGQELRELLGEDAGVLLRLTYLGEAERAALLGDPDATPRADVDSPPPALDPESATASEPAPASEPAQAAQVAPDAPAARPEAPAAPEAQVAPAAPAAPEAPAPRPEAPAAAAAPAAPDRVARRIVARDMVRFFGTITVADDEQVDGDIVVLGGRVRMDGEAHGDIVVIGGSLDVNGYVARDVVVVGGSARFGPEASLRSEVTVVGGPVSRAPTAEFRRGINHVGFGGAFGGGDWFGDGRFRPYYVADLAGTVVRFILLALLASLIVFVGGGSVERVARRCREEPVKAGLVGFLAQVLLVPVLLAGVFLLVISVIGIPFLLLLPFLGLALFVVMLVGFTGVVHGIGAWIGERFGRTGPAPYLTVWGGMAILLIPAMASDAMRAAGNFFTFFAVLFTLTGLLVEYLAWTTGFGAIILNRFGSAAQPGGAPGGPPGVPLPPAMPAPPTPAPPVQTPPRTAAPVTVPAPRMAAPAPTPPGPPRVTATVPSPTVPPPTVPPPTTALPTAPSPPEAGSTPPGPGSGAGAPPDRS